MNAFLKGPTHWDELGYDTCKGKHQSPIDINILYVKKVKLPPLILENFDIQPVQTLVTNNGHTGKNFFKNKLHQFYFLEVIFKLNLTLVLIMRNYFDILILKVGLFD